MRSSITRRRTAIVLATMLVAGAGSALLAWQPPAFAQTATGVTFESAFARMQQAAPGQTAAIDAAVEQFEQLVAQQPGDPVLRAYLGAATAMRATTTVLPWRKISHAEDGLALLDKALAQLTPAHDAPAHRGVPVALETRFVAANTFLRLPVFFNRNERGRQLLAAVLASPLFDAAPLGFRAAVWLRAGELAADDREPAQARQWYERVAATAAPQAATARSRLKEL
ncbi:MAG: hypothetical protein U1E89_11135 [Burkholderiaceae bacterium]